LTLIPVLISFAFNKTLTSPGKSVKKRRNRVLPFLEKTYAKVLDKLLNHYKKTVFIGFGLVLVLIGFSFKLGTEFLPELDEGSIFLRGNFPSGITIQENAKYAPKIRQIISH